MGLIEIVNPVGEPAQRSVTLQPPVKDLKGLVVGVISNRKPGFDVLVERLRQRLVEECGVAEVRVVQKPSASVAARAEELDTLAAISGVAISGLGD